MECKGCGKDLGEEEYRNVASWPFCLECFARLMETPAKEEGRADHLLQIEEGSAPSDAFPNPRCGLCGRELEAGQEVKLGIWTLCLDCRQSLIAAPDAQAPPSERTAQGEAGSEEVSSEEPAEAPRIRFHIQTDFMKSVNCNNCGRRIPEGGSRLLDGKPYCPECYHSRSKEEAAGGLAAGTVHSSRTASPVGEMRSTADLDEISTGAEPVCESCGREPGRGTLMQVEGFAICQACLTTDPDLALWIARARHQKRLQRIKNEIDA